MGESFYGVGSISIKEDNYGLFEHQYYADPALDPLKYLCEWVCSVNPTCTAFNHHYDPAHGDPYCTFLSNEVPELTEMLAAESELPEGQNDVYTKIDHSSYYRGQSITDVWKTLYDSAWTDPDFFFNTTWFVENLDGSMVGGVAEALDNGLEMPPCKDHWS